MLIARGLAVQLRGGMPTIRRCRHDERDAIFAIVNTAAEAYRDVIPPDRWHEPYMPMEELEAEIAAGVEFWGYEDGGALLGVMGVQPVRNVDLIRHAYVLPETQGRGIGGALLEHIMGSATRRVLVGTWAAAGWAVAFYRKHGFQQVTPSQKDELLRTYWTIPERQVETSVVLARPPLPHLPLPGDAELPEEYAAAREREGRVMAILRALGPRAEVPRAFVALADAVLYGPAALGRRERELLALATSQANGAAYSSEVHGGLLDRLGGRKGDARDEALAAFARRLTLAPREAAEAVAGLREHLSVAETYDAIAVVGLLNLANRAALATGISTADDLA
jgi:uncharacterized peroxidase-related enzyme